MRKSFLAAGAAIALVGGAANAAESFNLHVADAQDDLLASFAGVKASDLDLTGFDVAFDGTSFRFGVSVAGDTTQPSTETNQYVIGVDFGTGNAGAPFGNIGEGGITFNKAIGVSEGATSVTVNGHVEAVNFNTNGFSLVIPLADLGAPAGADADQFGFSVWSKTNGLDVTGNPFGANAKNADFAPDNRVAGVPEPTSWALMILGFGCAGAALRRRDRGRRFAAVSA